MPCHSKDKSIPSSLRNWGIGWTFLLFVVGIHALWLTAQHVSCCVAWNGFVKGSKSRHFNLTPTCSMLLLLSFSLHDYLESTCLWNSAGFKFLCRLRGTPILFPFTAFILSLVFLSGYGFTWNRLVLRRVGNVSSCGIEMVFPGTTGWLVQIVPVESVSSRKYASKRGSIRPVHFLRRFYTNTNQTVEQSTGSWQKNLITQKKENSDEDDNEHLQRITDTGKAW
jgi:hypothetical protein